MREILFRGKTISTGEWIESCNINTQYDMYGKKHMYIGLYFQSEFFPLQKNIEWHEVEPKTIGQYTGLTDIKGVKIFEGDIVKQEHHSSIGDRTIISVIEYGIGYSYSNVYGVCQRFSDGSGTAMLSVFNESGMVLCDVIGNIHDNPDLLKGAEQ